MNPNETGALIRMLRERQHLTQAALAEQLCISDKTVSKWETGKGCPDISLLPPLAKILHVSVSELLSGHPIVNTNRCANLLRSRFYMCPVCGNIIHSTGEAAVSCHGIPLQPYEAREPDACHPVSIEIVEDEYYIRINHPMTKTHYISMVAALSENGLQMIRLYPEGDAGTRLPLRGVRSILFYCNQDGLFSLKTRPSRLSP